MAYKWVPDESLDAWKLNQMQIDPLLKAVNNSGVRGGIESSALNSDTIACDIGTGAARSVAEEITEHELGNIHYEYDGGNNRWAMRSGSPGVTGKVEGPTGELEWNSGDFTGKQVNWQKITTDKWGNVICSEQVIDCSLHSTKMWSPKTCEGGEIWRRMGTIEADCKYKLPEGKSALMTWKYKAVNENNAFILPVPRQDGWEIPDVVNVCTDAEAAPRTLNSHWIQTAGPDTGASVPIQGVGELGGIFAYQAQDYYGNNVGIGLASGIEFYDCDTINCRNTDNPRPNSTTAKVDFGSCGKYGYIQISNVNPKHPWQFQLSGRFDPGTGFRPDPGTGGTAICKAQGPICYQGAGYYGWIGRGSDPAQVLKEGIIDGSITRLTNGANLYCGKYSDMSYAYRPGEIIDGGIGIATAKFEWTSPYNKNKPVDGNVIANNHGGIVTGIVNDSLCRAYIDDNGFIHLPNPEWMGEHGVKIPCANTELKNTVTYPYYLWPAFNKNMWCHTQPQYNDGGRVSGEIVVIKPTIGGKQDTPQIYPDANGIQYLWPQMGQVKEGVIGIPNAFFAPYACIDGNETEDMRDWLTADGWTRLQYRWSPGVIRGVVADIPWLHLYVNKKIEYTYPPEGEDWPLDELPDCVGWVEFYPDNAPYIDANGILHLPTTVYRARKEAFTCCGTTETRLVNFMPVEPRFFYSLPREAPAGRSKSSFK